MRRFWEIGRLSYLPFLGFILLIFTKDIRKEVATATGDMYQWAFLAKTETCSHCKHHGQRLHYKRPAAQVATDDEPT